MKDCNHVSMWYNLEEEKDHWFEKFDIESVRSIRHVLDQYLDDRKRSIVIDGEILLDRVQVIHPMFDRVQYQ